MTECDSVWSPAEVLTKYFNCIDKAQQQLAHANVQIDESAIMLKALKSFKDDGNYNAPIQEWEARPTTTQTYAKLKTVMSTEYSKLNCQDAVTARATGYALANVVEEFAQATDELVAELTKKHLMQIEALVKSNLSLPLLVFRAKHLLLHPPLPQQLELLMQNRLNGHGFGPRRDTLQRSAHIATSSIPTVLIPNAGNWRPTLASGLQDGNRQRAIDGAWGFQ
jgi:hypothetical protein